MPIDRWRLLWNIHRDCWQDNNLKRYLICHKVRTYRHFLLLPYHRGAAFAKHRRLNLKIVTRGNIVLKSGVFCQEYHIARTLPDFARITDQERTPRDFLGTRLLLIHWFQKKTNLHDQMEGVIMTLHKATVELLNYVLSHKCCKAESNNNQTLLAWSMFTFFHLLSKGIHFKNERVNEITLHKHFVEQNL